MENSITFTMIKPCAFANGFAGKIIDRILSAGFEMVAMKKTLLSADEAAAFYAVHKGKPFYTDLVAFMSSGPIVALVLRKENAVSEFRTLIGATNPENAAEGTIRKSFAESMSRNAVHGSDSDENAQIEANFFFSQRELL